MLEKKKGFPQEGELVVVTVTNIQYNSVFVKLDEYDNNKQGMIHISEISPGRIRNLRDFVKEGKVIICKVLKIHEARGHIDLSLRRVSEGARRQKQEDMKRMQKAEKIIEFVAKETKQDIKVLTKLITEKAKEFDNIYSMFEAVVEEDVDLVSVGFEKELASKLDEQIRQKIKPASVKIEGTLTLTSHLPNGVESVKEALIAADETSDKLTMYYEGAGHFRVEVGAPDYKEAEQILEDALKVCETKIVQSGGTYKFDRIETKK